MEQEELLPNTIGHNLISSNQNVHSFNEHINDHHQEHNDHQDHSHHHHYDVGSMAKEHDSMFSFFILMFATSVHSLFEG